MKLFIVEDNPVSIIGFVDAITKRGWSYKQFSLTNPKASATNADIRRFLKEVCDERPDVVLLDAALTKKEEKLLDELNNIQAAEIGEDRISGFRLCRALASEHLGVPIIVLTKYDHGQVARTAVQNGADRVIVKKSEKIKNKHIIRDIEDLVNSRTPHDSAFYWSMRNDLDTRQEDMWQGSLLQKALNRFFLNISSVRRFGMFTASLRDLLTPLFQGDVEAEKKLMIGLVKSQVLLSLVDPRLRDHVKHTGNVFWMGYRILNDIKEFREPTSLRGCIPSLYSESGELSPRDQLMYAWTLASLFHDIGYVNEKQAQLAALVTSLVPGMIIQPTDVRSDNWPRNMTLIRDFVSAHLQPSHFLHGFIDSVISAFDSDFECRVAKGKKMPLVDHGFLSANRLLDMIPLDSLDTQKKTIVLHAAVAIACHHHIDMIHKWKFPDKCKGNLSLGELPVCSLLAFCDSLQTWDRELEADPALMRTEAYDTLLERLVLAETAYISGSEIREFSLPKNDSSEYDLTLRLRYFVEGAVDVEKVCESLGSDIKRWIDSNRLRQVCNMTGISSILHGKVIYELPMLTGTYEITF
jgi:CheY-like chemotaxis protein